MPLPAVTSLLDAIRAIQLLRPAQLNELERDAAVRFPEVRNLAQHLIECGWLTPYQVNRLLLSKGADLILGPYVLIARLASGFGGEVFKARHQRMDRIVALRLVRRELLADPEAIAQFYAQVEAASKLKHENVLHAYDAGPIAETHFLATEYVRGIDLGQLVGQNGPLPIYLACDLTRQAALGLQHGHDHGLAHLGLKPSKLIVTQRTAPDKRPANGEPEGSSSVTRPGIVKIIDLGLGRLLRAPAAGQARESATAAAHYLAPEQTTDGQAVDCRADIYSLGCVFCFLLTGQAPAPGRPVQELRPEVTGEITELLGRMLAPDPRDRPQTPGEVAMVLDALTAHHQPASDERDFFGTAAPPEEPIVHSLPEEPPPQPRGKEILPELRWTFLVACSGGLLILGALLVHIWLFSDPGVARPPTGEKLPAPPVPEWLDGRTLTADDRKLAPNVAELVAVLRHDAKIARAVAFQPRGDFLACGGEDGVINLWDWPSGKRQVWWDAHSGKGVVSLAFTPDGQTLASGGRDKKVKVWDMVHRKERQSFAIATEWASSVAYSPDGQFLLYRHGPTSFRVTDPTGQKEPGPRNIHKTLIALAISPDSKTIALGTAERTIQLHDASGLKKIQALEGHTGPVRTLGFSLDGKFLASGSEDKQVKLWNVASGTLRATLTGHTRAVQALAFAPEGQVLISASEDGHVIFWQAASDQPVLTRRWDLTGPVHDLAISRDGRFLVTASANGMLGVFRLTGP